MLNLLSKGVFRKSCSEKCKFPDKRLFQFHFAVKL